jgi:hypothetical protein
VKLAGSTRKRKSCILRWDMSFEDDVLRKVETCLDRISSLPVAVLIWGPDVKSGTVIADTRLRLKETLIADGHLARFSEELVDPKKPHSIIAQQFAHADAFDIVVSLPGSPGSIAEIHDFARMPGVGNKIVAFIDRAWNDGYANKTLLQIESTLTSRVQLYSCSELPDRVITVAQDYVHRLQELQYCFFGRRC